jgi:hypothetical protein
MPRQPTISVSRRTHARLLAVAAARGVTMALLLEQALGYAATARAQPRPRVAGRPSITLRVDSPQTRWARRRREANDAAGLCLNENNSRTHGLATHGKLCAACRAVHRGSPVEVLPPIAVLVDRVFAAIAMRNGSARRISAKRHDTLARVHGITVDATSGLYVRNGRAA